MEKIKKCYKLKTVVMTVSIMLSFAWSLYAASYSKQVLRLPVGQDDMLDRMRKLQLYADSVKQVISELLQFKPIVISTGNGDRFLLTLTVEPAKYFGRKWYMLKLATVPRLKGKDIVGGNRVGYVDFRIDLKEKHAYMDTDYNWAQYRDVDAPIEEWERADSMIMPNEDSAILMYPEYRKRGLGRVLMIIALEIAKREGMNDFKIRERASIEGSKLYDSVGFEGGLFDLININIPELDISLIKDENAIAIVKAIEIGRISMKTQSVYRDLTVSFDNYRNRFPRWKEWEEWEEEWKERVLNELDVIEKNFNYLSNLQKFELTRDLMVFFHYEYKYESKKQKDKFWFKEIAPDMVELKAEKLISILKNNIEFASFQSGIPVLFLDTNIMRRGINITDFKNILPRLKINKNVPIILLTQYSEEEMRLEFKKKDISLEGIEFRTLEQLRLESFNLKDIKYPIEDTLDLLCLPLSEPLFLIPLKKEVRDDV